MEKPFTSDFRLSRHGQSVKWFHLITLTRTKGPCQSETLFFTLNAESFSFILSTEHLDELVGLSLVILRSQNARRGI